MFFSEKRRGGRRERGQWAVVSSSSLTAFWLLPTEHISHVVPLMFMNLKSIEKPETPNCPLLLSSDPGGVCLCMNGTS